MRHAGLFELAESTLAPGESISDLLSDRSAFEDFDPDAAAQRDFGFVRLNQLAVEHVLARP
jgi:xylose isomerase